MLANRSPLLAMSGSGHCQRGPIVLRYRLYKIDRNDEVDGPPQVITCEDDDAALIEARIYIDRHAIEI
jgi:hypothetical protein